MKTTKVIVDLFRSPTHTSQGRVKGYTIESIRYRWDEKNSSSADRLMLYCQHFGHYVLGNRSEMPESGTIRFPERFVIDGRAELYVQGESDATIRCGCVVELGLGYA